MTKVYYWEDEALGGWYATTSIDSVRSYVTQRQQGQQVPATLYPTWQQAGTAAVQAQVV